MVESTYTDEKSKKYYAWQASNYDALAKWEEPFHMEAVQLANAQNGQHVLVVACGTGRGMVGLAEAVGPTGRVDAMDLSEEMIEQARANALRSELETQLLPTEIEMIQAHVGEKTFETVLEDLLK